MMSFDDGYPEYVSVGERKRRAARKIEKLKKKNPEINPVIIKGSQLSETWWGKAWNKNLEAYADYSTRIGRGRSYVRHGAVLDLRIQPGKVIAQVLGSRSKPYSIEIDIDPVPEIQWEKLKRSCEGKLASMATLLAGKIPVEMQEALTKKGSGLFPSPKEIKFKCNCPDWASMCKHIAAVLYGIGSRLDDDPALFFILRKVHVDDLVSELVNDRTRSMLGKAKKKTERVIEDSDIAAMFGIDMEQEVQQVKKKPAQKRVAKKQPVQKKTIKKETVQNKAVEKKPAQKKTARAKAPAKKKSSP